MAVGFPTKVTYANGDVFSASDINDTNGTINLINPSAKGDLFAGSAANTYTKLSVGTNGQVLSAASGEATGLQWVTPVSGGMTLLSTTSLTGASTTVSSISQAYTRLLGVIHSGYSSAGAAGWKMTVNGNACSSLYNSGTTTWSNTDSGFWLAYSVGGGFTGASVTFTIDSYTKTDSTKPISSFGGGRPSTVDVAYSASGHYPTKATAVTSLTFAPSTGSWNGSGVVLLYGVK